jgi:hypothetical protein
VRRGCLPQLPLFFSSLHRSYMSQNILSSFLRDEVSPASHLLSIALLECVIGSVRITCRRQQTADSRQKTSHLGCTTVERYPRCCYLVPPLPPVHRALPAIPSISQNSTAPLTPHRVCIVIYRNRNRLTASSYNFIHYAALS